ncbi:MAG: hypothetical protein ACM3O4_03755 [Ignavibacteriales bacterium]
MSILDYIKKNKKNIITITVIMLTPFILPLLTTLIEIIYHYGTYVGTFARSISTGNGCF